MDAALRKVPGPLSAEERARRYDELVASLARRARPVILRRKADAWHQRAAATALRVLTLGGQDRYLSTYVTTLGHTIYVPAGWDDWDPGDRYCVLRHELVHVEQFERWSFPVMMILYGVLPLPLGLAWFRARFEMEAYRTSFDAHAEVWGLEDALGPTYRAQVTRRFTGPDYAWMWPFPRTVDRWAREAQEEVRLAYGGDDLPSLLT